MPIACIIFSCSEKLCLIWLCDKTWDGKLGSEASTLLVEESCSYILKRKISVLQCMSVWFSRRISIKKLKFMHMLSTVLSNPIYQTLLFILSTVEHVHKCVIPSTIQMTIIGGEHDTYRQIHLLLKIPSNTENTAL